MAARKDIHRPSVINPADYEYVAVEVMKTDSFGDCEALLAERAIIKAHMKRTGGNYSGHAHKGNCHVCGAHAVYTVLFYHAATNTYIRTGMDCASKMHACDENLFRRIRDEVTASLEARAGKLKAKGILAKNGLEACWDIYEMPWNLETLPGLVEQGWATSKVVETEHYDCYHPYDNNERHSCPKCKGWGSYTGPLHNETVYDVSFEFRTIRDIVGKLVKYGSISDNQLSFLGKLLRDKDTRKEREAKFAAEKAKAADCPTGRVTVECEVIKAEWRTTDFGDALKITLKAVDGGYILWGNAPVDLRNPEVKRGDKVQLTATVKPSDKDPKFGFFSRPIGKVLSSAVA